MYQDTVFLASQPGDYRQPAIRSSAVCGFREKRRSLHLRERCATLQRFIQDVAHAAVAAKPALLILLGHYTLYGVSGLMAYRWPAVRNPHIG